MNFSEMRNLFPVTQHNIFLNNAAESPLNEKVRKRLEEYALVTSTGVGIGIIASGFNWNRGDNVVLPSDEHWEL